MTLEKNRNVNVKSKGKTFNYYSFDWQTDIFHSGENFFSQNRSHSTFLNLFHSTVTCRLRFHFHRFENKRKSSELTSFKPNVFNIRIL